MQYANKTPCHILASAELLCLLSAMHVQLLRTVGVPGPFGPMALGVLAVHNFVVLRRFGKGLILPFDGFI
jgi:hypothetical protein